MSPGDRPRLPRGVRLHEDRVRGATVLLGPEIALILDGPGEAILSEVDGARDVTAISADLARRFEAPEAEIVEDVLAFLNDLVLRRLVETA